MVTDDHIEASKALQRRTGTTFHVATRTFPDRYRHPTYVLYAFFRTADEVVDDPDPPTAADRRAELDRIRAVALGDRPAEDPVLAAFQDLRERRAIPDREVRTFVDAMEMDVSKTRYDTRAELDDYLRGSSVAVARMMLAIMDPPRVDVARPHAAALGKAFQLTNFLRDVREDVLEYDRIYLPRSVRSAHGVTDEDVESLSFSSAFADLMREELRRTEQLYHVGVDGIRHLPEDCRFAVLLAAVMYADHHRLIRRLGYDVLSTRPSLTLGRRLALVARTWWHWRQTDDPLTAFYRASPLSPPPGWSPESPAALAAAGRHVAGALPGVEAPAVDGAPVGRSTDPDP
jgi:phytoene synthase